MLKLLFVLILAMRVSAVASAGEGVPIEITIENRSNGPLRCLLVFAHWTTLDLPVLAPGAETSMMLNRAPDRALFVPRPQDGRPMMLEALHCGHDSRWSQSLVKLDWAGPMRSNARAFLMACVGEERLLCRWQEAVP
jgi:hypothetical protein